MKIPVGRWWHTPLIPALGRQRQWISVSSRPAWFTRASSRTGSKTIVKPCLEKPKKKKKKSQEKAIKQVKETIQYLNIGKKIIHPNKADDTTNKEWKNLNVGI